VELTALRNQSPTGLIEGETRISVLISCDLSFEWKVCGFRQFDRKEKEVM